MITYFYIILQIHSLELRQKVRGRSKPFADLLHEYKRQKKIKKMQKRPGGALSSSTLPPPLPPSPAPSSIVPCSPVGSSTSPVLYPPPSLSTGAPTSPLSSSLLVYLDESDSEEYCITSDVSQRQQLLSSSDPPPGPTASVLSEAQLYPKPGAVSSLSFCCFVSLLQREQGLPSFPSDCSLHCNCSSFKYTSVIFVHIHVHVCLWRYLCFNFSIYFNIQIPVGIYVI